MAKANYIPAGLRNDFLLSEQENFSILLMFWSQILVLFSSCAAAFFLREFTVFLLGLQDSVSWNSYCMIPSPLAVWVEIPLESRWGAPKTSERVSTEYEHSLDFQPLMWLNEGRGGWNLTDSPNIWMLPRPYSCLTPQLNRASSVIKPIQNDTVSSDGEENLQVIMRRLLF